MRETTRKKLFLFLLMVLMSFSVMTVTTQAASVGTPRITSIPTRTSDVHRVRWTRVPGATGYVVACRAPGSGLGYKKVATILNGTTNYANIKKRLPNVTYTYRVRAFTMVNGKRSYGSWSARRKAILNKNVAIYGRTVSYSQYGRFYSSSIQARSNMKSIRVKVWDFRNGKKGAKYTRNFTITVHKNIATTVKRIFNEIYKSSDKPPIHDLGGWRWDGSRSEHQDGTAIDINANENPYIVNGRVVVGSSYNPGTDPYSIPQDGTIANIFKKYGFSQGLWRNTQDYMHFSYFGT